MKTTVTLCMLFFLLSGAEAQCLSGDCRNGIGIFVFPDGERYIGQFSDGKREGIGRCFYTDGSSYQGGWVKGFPEGEGVKVEAGGSRREGRWKKGRLEQSFPVGIDVLQAKGDASVRAQTGCVSGDCNNGKGIYIFPNGAIYIGDFYKSEIHGLGVCHYPDGSKYQGAWAHRYPDGKGTRSYPDGRKWVGRWQRGLPVDDQGRLLDQPATMDELTNTYVLQTGCLQGDCRNGQGTYAYPDGSRYEGDFRNGKPEGNGRFFYPSGARYVGQFRQGLRHGQGTMYHEDGTVSYGWWQEGEYTGREQSGYRPRQAGCVEGNCESGFGVYIFKDGAKYIGTFREKLPHGRGVVYYSNGEKYEGEMAQAAFNGYGTLYLQDGNKLSGLWQNGAYLGNGSGGIQATPPVQAIPETYSRPQESRNGPRVWAVIIGVSAYDHMPVLRYPDDDAYRIFAFLKSPEGGALPDDQIRILVDEDATRQRIKDTMRELFGQAGPNDLVFLYFSGHGLPGCFLPIDYDGVSNQLRHEEINAIFDQSRARYKLCIADACHSGSLLAMRGGEPSVLVKYYETLAQARPGTALIMSSKSEETSLESSGLRQGVFSHYLIRGLKGEADADLNQIVTVRELFDFVYRNVRAYTGNRQSPVIRGDYDPMMTVSAVR